MYSAPETEPIVGYISLDADFTRLNTQFCVGEVVAPKMSSSESWIHVVPWAPKCTETSRFAIVEAWGAIETDEFRALGAIKVDYHLSAEFIRVVREVSKDEMFEHFMSRLRATGTLVLPPDNTVVCLIDDNHLKMSDEMHVYHMNNRGQLHSFNDEPAVIRLYTDVKYWYKDGKRHRDNDLPAVEDPDVGTYVWYVNGKEHRDNGLPAAIFMSGREQEWWYHGFPIKVERHNQVTYYTKQQLMEDGFVSSKNESEYDRIMEQVVV